MSKKWYKASAELPERDPAYINVSVEVIVETAEGSQLWGFCDLSTGMWYRTDGNVIEKVKRWRYGRGFSKANESA